MLRFLYIHLYQFMDDPANSDSNYFFEDDNGLNLFKDLEDEEDDDEDDEEDVDLFGEDEVRAELEEAGLDYNELENLDPDDYDF